MFSLKTMNMATHHENLLIWLRIKSASLLTTKKINCHWLIINLIYDNRSSYHICNLQYVIRCYQETFVSDDYVIRWHVNFIKWVYYRCWIRWCFQETCHLIARGACMGGPLMSGLADFRDINGIAICRFANLEN
jgi:hypothetical protein